MDNISSEIGKFKLESAAFFKCDELPENHKIGTELHYRYARIFTRFRQTLRLKNQPYWLITGATYEITRDWNLN